MLELREGDLESFFRVPFAAYGAESLYVSPLASDLKRFLDAEANPLFRRFGARRFFTALRDGRPVGRLVAHVHRPANERHGLARSYFGYFDCVDDLETARLLLAQAEAFGREQGAAEVAGNFNLTAMQQMGVLTEGFENAPYTDQLYGPPHLPRLLAACDYAPFFPMTTWEVDLEWLDAAALAGPKQQAAAADPGLRWTTLRRRGFRAQLRDVCRVLNEGFDRNPLFVPLTEEEFLFQAEDMMWIVDERISCLVHAGERPVGVVVCIPDLNPFLRATGSRLTPLTPWHFLRARWRRERAVIVFYAVAPSAPEPRSQRRHAPARHGGAAGRRLPAPGDHLDRRRQPPSLRQVERLGARRLHRLQLFRKALA